MGAGSPGTRSGRSSRRITVGGSGMARGWRSSGRANGRHTGRLCVVFFQAEDGIRYLTVTGVQTCALPILAQLGDVAGERAAVRLVLERRDDRHRAAISGDELAVLTHVLAEARAAVAEDAALARSEERRVGKEGRSRWSPYH